MGKFQPVIEVLDRTPLTIGELAQIDQSMMQQLQNFRTSLLQIDALLAASAEISAPSSTPQPETAPEVPEAVTALPIVGELETKTPEPKKAKVNKGGRQPCDPSEAVECTICGRPCASEGYLRRHMELKHPAALVKAEASLEPDQQPEVDESTGDDDGVDIITVPKGQVSDGYAARGIGRRFK